jgi:hypothetical protein
VPGARLTKRTPTGKRCCGISSPYAYPLRIVAFNAVEGWFRDATEDIANALADELLANGSTSRLRSKLSSKPMPSRPIALPLPLHLFLRGAA